LPKNPRFWETCSITNNEPKVRVIEQVQYTGGDFLNVFIRIKAAGKRRDMLEKQPLILGENPVRGEDLIVCLVRENVRAYNSKTADTPFFPYLTRQELDDGVYTGRIGFGDRKNEKRQDEEEAVRNALQCFSDGIYRLLVNETEIGPGAALNLQEGDTLTFIRLVMLAGRRF
jgi:hypothetical protein